MGSEGCDARRRVFYRRNKCCNGAHGIEQIIGKVKIFRNGSFLKWCYLSKKYMSIIPAKRVPTHIYSVTRGNYVCSPPSRNKGIGKFVVMESRKAPFLNLFGLWLSGG